MSARADHVSVVVPAYNAEQDLGALTTAFDEQTVQPGEILLIDDGSTDATARAAGPAFRVVRMERNSGPAAARNRGLELARGAVAAFTDSDCRPAPDWVAGVARHFEDPALQVVMGAVRMLPGSTFSDSVSALGFPAGGSVGFDRIWHVDEAGHTDHISSCNFAARVETLRGCGGFDTGFRRTYGEDAELSFRLCRMGISILYCPDLVVSHPPIASFAAFVRNQLARGRGNYHFKRKVGPVSSFVRLRLWSCWNILKARAVDPKLPLIALLLGLSFLLQQTGYLAEAGRRRRHRG